MGRGSAPEQEMPRSNQESREWRRQRLAFREVSAVKVPGMAGYLVHSDLRHITEPGSLQRQDNNVNVLRMFWSPLVCKIQSEGQPGWLSGLASPSAQGVILEIRNRGPHRAPCMEPASLALSLSLSLFHE